METTALVGKQAAQTYRQNPPFLALETDLQLYTYDPNGNILSIVDGRSGESLTYAYDANNRLDWMKIDGATSDNPVVSISYKDWTN